MAAYYLGLDSSTQSLSAILIRTGADAPAAIMFEHDIRYDDELPHHGTRHGLLPREDPAVAVAVAPPLMWAEALERMFAAIVASGIDLSRIAAVSGAAQQHGSVYLGAAAADVLARLDPSRALAEQLVPPDSSGAESEETQQAPGGSRASAGIFSRAVSPIWMDASTSAECAEITAAFGGPEGLAGTTGSRACERFTGPQIRKFARRDPPGWAATARVHLVSSFMASLLAGGHAPLDPGDASGMNLMDLRARDWSAAALAATTPDLAARLPPIVPSHTIIGVLSPYWRERFGLPAARLVAWSGDNPCSLIGTGLVREGRIAISLGTSDTLFGLMHEPRVDASGTGHVFGAPTGDYMGLTCFLNGSLARQRIRDRHGLDWDGFAAALRATPPGNNGALMFPWFAPEITPHVAEPAARRVDLDPADGPRNVRAVVEAQMMALANHSRWMGVNVDVIHATGGAAVNTALLQVMADVFGAEVRRFKVGNSACLGAALRAWHADALAAGNAVPWEEIVRGIAEPEAGNAIRPIADHVAIYARQRRRYGKLEPLAIRGCRADARGNTG